MDRAQLQSQLVNIQQQVNNVIAEAILLRKQNYQDSTEFLKELLVILQALSRNVANEIQAAETS